MTRDSYTDKELWARAKARRGDSAVADPAGEPGSAEDMLLLSAYLDGRLEKSELDSVEGRLAAEPELLDAMLSARQALDESPAPAPEAAVARAQAIVGAPAKAERRSGGFLAGWLQPLGWAAVCALALIVSGAGFEIGREGYDAVVEYQTLMTETVAFEMPDPASDLIL